MRESHCLVCVQVKCMQAAGEEQGPMRSQVLYNFGLCLWLLSFDENGMEEIKKPAVVVPLVNLLKEGEQPHANYLISSVQWAETPP